MRPKLLFVYNASSGFFNKLTDFAHKFISPGTYACSLCTLTYGKYKMKQEWAKYIEQLPVEVEFVYKDKWTLSSAGDEYPLVVLQTGEDKTEVLLTAEELNSLKSLKELKYRLSEALHHHCF